MDMKVTMMIALLAMPVTALADSYKCVDQNGKVSFAFTPCPTWVGESTYHSETQATTLDNPEAASAEVVRRNLRAAEEINRSRQRSGTGNGQLTIVPDTTSKMGRERARQEDLARRRAERDARIAAGLEPPRQKPIRLNCYSYGYRNQYTTCNGQ